MPKIALCYIRKSLVRTASDEISPERQRKSIVAEAERHGWIVEVFEDAEGHRSGRTEKRPGWQQLKARLDDPGVQAVIVESLSRASRSIRDLFNFAHELEARNIALISLKEKFDTTTAMGRAFLGVIAILNQFESDVASERMKMTVAHIRNSRKQHWGYVPFGCVRAKPDHKLVPSREGVWRIGNAVVAGNVDIPPFAHSDSAQWFGYLDAVRKAFNLYTMSDKGFIELADQLNSLGFLYRDRHGVPRPFHTDDVRRMIDLVEIYAGHFPQKQTKDRARVLDAHPAILPRELCDKVMIVHQARHVRWGRGGGAPKQVYLLVNLYCKECGSHLKGQFVNGVRYYRHSDQQKPRCSQTSYIRAERIETAVFDRLACFQTPEEMKTHIREKVRRLVNQNPKTEWADARKKLTALDNKLERLRTLYIEGEVEKGEYQRRKARLDEQKQETSQILNSAPLDMKKLESLLPKVDQISSIIRQGTPTQQREACVTLFERVEVLGNAIVKVILREWAQPFCNGEPKQSKS